MPASVFFRQLLLLTLLMGALLVGLHFLPVFRSHWPLSLGALAFFVLLSGVMFFLARIFTRQGDKQAFIPLVMFFVLIKIFFSILIVAIYFYQQAPADKFFVIPFFLIYLAYTIFETHFLMIMAKSNPNS